MESISFDIQDPTLLTPPSLPISPLLQRPPPAPMKQAPFYPRVREPLRPMPVFLAPNATLQAGRGFDGEPMFRFGKDRNSTRTAKNDVHLSKKMKNRVRENRRAKSIAEGIQVLRNLLPRDQQKPPTKAEILRMATQYIAQLQQILACHDQDHQINQQALLKPTIPGTIHVSSDDHVENFLSEFTPPLPITPPPSSQFPNTCVFDDPSNGHLYS